MPGDSKEYWIGFDLGGTKMLATLFDTKLNVLAQQKRKTKAYEGVNRGLDRITSTISETLHEAQVNPSRLTGIGVGCPGPLNLKKGVIMEAPNLGWQNVQLRKHLESSFGCPAVIANDVDTGTYGEYVAGAAKGAWCALGVFPGTGIGAGCVLNNTIVQGKTNSCLEIGHLSLVENGSICGCGQHGCLETVASRLAIASAAAAAAFRGQAPYLLERTGTDISKIRSKVLAESIVNGDSAVEDIVRHAASWIGKAVGIVVNLLAPDVVVMGGGLVEAMPDLICSEVERSAKNSVLPTYRNSLKVVPAALGDNATVIGAAAWARRVIAES